MSKVSKMVGDRLLTSEKVIQAMEAQGATIAAAVREREAARLPAGLTVEEVVAWLRASLRHAHEQLAAADLAHAGELIDDVGPRRERDEAQTALRAAMISASSAVRGVCGEPYARKLGLLVGLETRADLLVTQARSAVQQLRAAPPADTLPGLSIDFAALASAIELPASRLADALAAVRREEREAQVSLSARDEAITYWERTYAGTAELFTGLALLAGRDDLAAKLRPTTRRKAGLPDEPEAPAAEG